jgi:hypothetical protein
VDRIIFVSKIAIWPILWDGLLYFTPSIRCDCRPGYSGEFCEQEAAAATALPTTAPTTASSTAPTTTVPGEEAGAFPEKLDNVLEFLYE